MPTLPKAPRTISQLVDAQLPDFVREDYPTFIAFLQAYYEWMEKNGVSVYEGKVVQTTPTTVVLTDTASIETNAYQGMSIVCLNGPAKGHTREVTVYDAGTRTVLIDVPWVFNNVPPPNTNMAIRDKMHPGKLLEYRDIDFTLDKFIDYFRDEFLYNIPGNILADKRNILKHIKQFYQAKGTENSFRFLFRILFNEEVEFYYPKVDLFRVSDAHWFTENVIKTTTTGNTFDYVNRQIIGVVSGTTAKVESATQQVVGSSVVTEFKISSIDGEFQIDPTTGKPEQVKIVYPVNPPPQTDLGSITDLEEPFNTTKWEQAYQLLQNLPIDTPGVNYQVGEMITIDGGGSLSPATAVITSVFQTYFNGGASPPPSTFYLEPFFGPNDTVNATEDFTEDGVCIPGMYYFSDVHSQYTDADLLNANEIMLSQNETTEDNFFVGDAIALVGGTGSGERSTIVSYNGTTKVATVDIPFTIIPDATTQYSITHVKGAIKSIKIVDFGLGFITTPTVTINTEFGSGAVLPPLLGLVGVTAGQWTPGRPGGIGEAPTTPDSFASSNKIIQDSFYWQDFSYDLRFAETIDKYRDVVKSLLHPAGFKMFGSVLLKSKPETNYLNIVKNYVIALDSKFFNMKLKVAAERTYHTINVAPDNLQTIGSKNKDLDFFKFTEFPPNKSWDIVYPYPNQNYWTLNGPGNTQINNFKDVIIGTIISFPDRRSKICADTYVNIFNDQSVTKVGPVGQSRATLARFKFVGFPPFENFDEVYPDPNQDYWVTKIGNTQLSSFKDIVISDVIESPEKKHSNFCVDGDIAIYRKGGIPVQGDQVEYNFVEGMIPQIVYNVSPNSHTGDFDAVLGTDILTESVDPTWVSQGININSSQQEVVNATGVPLNLSECTVIVVAMCPSLTDMSVVNCITNPTDNGFSLDVRSNGGLSFRVQNGGINKSISFPDNSIRSGSYFLAALRFNRGKLSGNVSNSRPLSISFPGYPEAPTANTPGWYFGSPTPDYTSTPETPSLFHKALFGTNKFKQQEVSGSPITVGYFNGILSYAIFYDRAIYDFELDFIYSTLQTTLLDERGIVLHDTNRQIQFGVTKIQIDHIAKIQTGIATIVKRQFQLGQSRIQTRSLVPQLGLTNIYGTTLKTQSGIASVKNQGTQTNSGVSRIELTHGLTLLGTTRITATTTQTKFGTSALVLRSLVTNSGVSRIRTTVPKTQGGITKITATTLKTQTGVAKIQNTTVKTEGGVARIRVTTLQTNSGVSRIELLTTKTQTGVSKLATETLQTSSGVSRIRVTTDQTQSGVTNIS